MTQAQIKITVAEDERFLNRAKVVLALINADSEYALCSNPKHTGALRRASLDLTRALAQMRRPG